MVLRENGSLPMKVAAPIFVLGISLNLLLTAQSPKPFRTVDLTRAKIAGSQCQIKLPEGLSSVVWLDDERLMASSFAAQCQDESASPATATEVVVFDIAGSVQATERTAVTLFAKGPRGTIAAMRSGEIELLDVQLHHQQTLTWPNSPKSCGITLAPNSLLDSEFAVCSVEVPQQQVCDFYRGWPAVMFRRANSQPEDPYSHLVDRHAWKVGINEIWFFSNGHLTRSEANKVSSPVSSEDFVGKDGGGCNGYLSEVEPRRFLAVCIGTHWYSDGMFDAIFGFSRVILFDVSSRSPIQRIDGPAYISAALSPSGKRVAILKGGKVRLYQVN